jgi:EAL domain-containing protein (putative c-di-GMP-specific phosphodiesterase class I)
LVNDRNPSLFGRGLRVDGVFYVIVVAVGLAVAWSASYASGGSKTPLTHLFYIPIIVASLAFSWPGAVATALAAGLLAGPLLPQDVDAGLGQTPAGWIMRLVMFAVMGLFIALILHGRASPLPQAVSDAIMSNRMRYGLRHAEIEPYYQPLYDLQSRTIIGVEALARWRHPQRGFIAPDTFLPATERTGAVLALDRFMLSQVATTVQAWSGEVGPIRAAVNLSAVGFTRNDLVEQVTQVLSETGLPAEQLELEITESAFMADLESAARQVAALRALGVRVSLDDFSAGQGSLLYLSRFPVDTVKLDQSLIEHVTEDDRLARLVAGVVVMLHGLDVELVGEGVETIEQLAYLDAVGCRLAQGFYIGRPLPAAEALELLRHRSDLDISSR